MPQTQGLPLSSQGRDGRLLLLVNRQAEGVRVVQPGTALSGEVVIYIPQLPQGVQVYPKADVIEGD